MSRFICDICGEDIAVHEGVLTWTRDDNTLSNFRLTHKNTADKNCRPENNRCKELYTLTTVPGFLEFIQYLLERWENGFKLNDAHLLKKVMEQLCLHIHEKVIMLVEDDTDG